MSRIRAGRRIFFSVLAGLMFFLVGTHYLCPTNARRKQVMFSEATCTKWRPANEIILRSQPRIKLNANKFLLPLLYNGPTNQLWGLRQAAYLAIVLNRTLVMPVFRKHITDESGPRERIDPNHRFQVEDLANLISVVNLEEYVSSCGKTPDEAFLAAPMGRWTNEELRLAEEELGLKFLRSWANGDGKISNPFLPSVKIKSSRDIKENSSLVKQVYDSDSKCALFVFPFREINMELKRGSWREDYAKFYQKFKTSLNQVPEWVITQALYLSTSVPVYVQEITEQFLQTVFGSDSYLAIHWRYDSEDFQKFMCEKAEVAGNPNQAAMCQKVSVITPEALGRAISNHIEYVQQNSKLLISVVYVATPNTPSALGFLEKLKSTLNRLGIDVVTQHDLKHFLRGAGMFERCDFLEKNFNEFSSLAEMEICSRSAVFLRSSYSSWSDSVIQSRVTWRLKEVFRRFDMHIVNLRGLNQ